MESPYSSPSLSSTTPKTRTDSTFSIHLTDTSGGIQKRSNSRSNRSRSISAAAIERHPELLPEQLQSHLNLGSHLRSVDWNPPNYSPQQQTLQVPSSRPSTSQSYGRPGAVSSQSGDLHLLEDGKDSSTSRSPRHSLPATTNGMASLGYLPPPQYQNMAFQDPSYDPNYQQMDSHSHGHPSNFGFLFGGSTAPAQQSIYASGPLHAEPTYTTAPLGSSLTHVSGPSLSNLNRAASPYHQPSFESLEYSLGVDRSISHSPLSSQHLGPLTPPLSSGLDSVQSHMVGTPNTQASMEPIRSPSVYDSQSYSSAYTVDPVQAAQSLYSAPHSFSYPPPPATSTRQQMPRSSTESQVRVLNQKPKPQCWEHGCNGREFSTFSNLLRHQREKSGTAAKSYCPKCGAEFTRTTARNGHLAHEKCSKPRRASELSEGK